MTEEKLIYEGDRLTEYLRKSVKKALINQHINVSEMSEFYLVNLLKEFQTIENLFVQEGNHFDEEPLAMILARAFDSNLPAKIRALKRLGDNALYIAGFFADHVERKSVDIDYYISMGGGAYYSLSNILADSRTFCELYSELSEKFSDFVRVLNEISLSQKVHTNLDILHLYERWLKTHDKRLLQILEEEGITPLAEEPKKV